MDLSNQLLHGKNWIRTGDQGAPGEAYHRAADRGDEGGKRRGTGMKGWSGRGRAHHSAMPGGIGRKDGQGAGGTGGDPMKGTKNGNHFARDKAVDVDRGRLRAETPRGSGGGVQAMAQTEEEGKALERPGRESGYRRGAGERRIGRRGAAGGACDPGER